MSDQKQKIRSPGRWSKLAKAIGLAQSEFKRTTALGKRMINASRANTELHEKFEELGHLAYQSLKKGDLDWSHLRAVELVKKITGLEKELYGVERELRKIKSIGKTRPKKKTTDS